MGYDFCKLRKNHDALYECNECQILGSMFEKRRQIDSEKSRNTRVLKTVVHDDFGELRKCAIKCVTCRVLYRAIWLRQITNEEVDGLRDLPGL